MWYPHAVTVAASSEPVTLDEVKAQTRVDGTADDTALTLMIAAARARVEHACGPIASRTVTVKCDSFDDFAAVPLPIISVSSVSYVDAAGATQTLSTDVYEVRADGLTGSLALKYAQAWPSIQTDSRITVTAVVGRASVPDDLKAVILLMVAQGNDDRASAPDWFNDLICNHRLFA
jgi:uncharacterized phiE125 gp8 family phage protein